MFTSALMKMLSGLCCCIRGCILKVFYRKQYTLKRRILRNVFLHLAHSAVNTSVISTYLNTRLTSHIPYNVAWLLLLPLFPADTPVHLKIKIKDARKY